MPRKSSGRSGKKSSVRSSPTAGARSSRKKTSARRGSSEERKVLSMPARQEGSSARGRSSGASRSAQSRALTEHDEIREWAEERGAHPACVRGTGSTEDVGMIRLDFPGYSGEQSLEEIDWDEWFRKFDESGLALLVQDLTARGQKSNFNKLVKQGTARAKAKRGSRSSRSGQKRRAA